MGSVEVSQHALRARCCEYHHGVAGMENGMKGARAARDERNICMFLNWARRGV
jgi:hypothetical protein